MEDDKMLMDVYKKICKKGHVDKVFFEKLEHDHRIFISGLVKGIAPYEPDRICTLFYEHSPPSVIFISEEIKKMLVEAARGEEWKAIVYAFIELGKNGNIMVENVFDDICVWKKGMNVEAFLVEADLEDV